MDQLNDLLSKSKPMLQDAMNTLDNVKTLEFDKIEKGSSLLIVVDMNNGFAKSGALFSPRVEKLIPKIELLTYRCLETQIHVVALNDSHNDKAREFNYYPPHCVKGSQEDHIVEELNKFKEHEFFHIINKNSTNGFHVFNPFDEFTLLNMEYIEHIILTGCVTDICVYQYALSLITYIHENALSTKVYLPINMVDTFSLENHDADLINLIYLKSLASNGITLVKDIL